MELIKTLTPFQKMPKNVGDLGKLIVVKGDLGKLIVVKGFKKLPKVQKIAQSGHTACNVPTFVS